MAIDAKESGGGRYAVGVWALFGAFVLFILVCVVIASRQDFHLVEDDYYRKGLSYQERIDNRTRTQALMSDVDLTYSPVDQTITIYYPPLAPADSLTGEIILYRPSNARWDQVYDVGPDSAYRQIIELGKLPAGFWRIKLDWTAGSQRYYSESSFMYGE